MASMLRILPILLMLLLPAAAQAAEPPILIRLSHVTAADTPKGWGAQLFRQLVEERLPGKVRVELYPDSILYQDPDAVQALIRGDVELLAPSVSKLERYAPQLGIFDLPYLFDDLEALDSFVRKPTGQRLLQILEAHGMTGLAYWHGGMKQLALRTPVSTPEDLQGLTLRIQPSPILADLYRQLGVRPLEMPFAGVRQALQQELIQGSEQSWSNLYTQHLYLSLPFITETNHGVLEYMLITNSRFWRSIPFQTRQELEKIIRQVTEQVNRRTRELEQTARAAILRSDDRVRITLLSPAQQQLWRETLQAQWQSVEDTIGPDLIQYAQRVNAR